MRELFFIIASERKMLRDYALAAGVIAFIALAGTYGLKAAVNAIASERAPKVAASDAAGVRTYTVVRSVLDDQPFTGSIQNLNNVRFDPCKKP